MNKTETMSGKRKRRGLMAIAVFKCVKGLLLLALATGMLNLLHKDVREVTENFIRTLRVDPDNRYIAGLLGKIGLIDDKKMEELTVLTFFYAALFLTEGIGLFMAKRWAEYLTIIATASFIPVEIYELTEHFGPVKMLLLIINLIIVGILLVIVREKESAT
jgi:uncharacterized membrane protein (DUF2068 family)